MHRAPLRTLFIVLPPLLLAIWLGIAGSYCWMRDFLGIATVTLIVAGLLWRRRREKDGSGSPPTPTLTSGLSASGAFGWLLACWIVLSALDAVFSPTALPLRGSVAAPASVQPAADKLRIGLALSGGGYRAALVHAGVLQELAIHGIPVTNIASVSGGSIIAAFVSRGGDPADFVDAVTAGRFRFKRDLLSAFNLPRWLLPVGSFSRRDVQASLVRRLLLANEPRKGERRPALMLAMTDLRLGLSIGVTESGFMFAGPTTARFFKTKEAITVDGLGDLASGDLATIVAVSSAFPGAFPALQTSARMTMVIEPLETSRDTRALPLALVDGGVRDNLGLKLLQTINQEARGAGNNSLSWPGFRPDPSWALDFVIVSDGGQSFDAAEQPMGLLSQAWRAIDLSGLETGILRPIGMSSELPIITLSIAAELGLSPDAAIVQSVTRARAEARRDVFLQQRLSAEALARIVNLLPARDNGRRALADYLRTRSGPMNISDVDSRCAEPAKRDAPECHWRTLADLVLDDIDAITAVFRRSATLEDQYSPEHAEALVRLGRYFVLLRLAEIKQALATAGNR